MMITVSYQISKDERMTYDCESVGELSFALSSAGSEAIKGTLEIVEKSTGREFCGTRGINQAYKTLLTKKEAKND